MVNPPSGTGNYEQGGLWFGNDEANYVKLVLLSSPNGLKLNFEVQVSVSGLVIVGTVVSPIKGAKGNTEMLALLRLATSPGAL